MIIFNKAALKAEDVQSYDDLANPEAQGKVCTRSGSHPYNLSLMVSIIAHQGEAKAESWAKGVVANFARAPPRAVTPTRSRPLLPANAPSPSPIPTTSPASCARTSPKTARSPMRSASSGQIRTRPAPTSMCPVAVC